MNTLECQKINKKIIIKCVIIIGYKLVAELLIYMILFKDILIIGDASSKTFVPSNLRKHCKHYIFARRKQIGFSNLGRLHSSNDDLDYLRPL